MTGDFEEYQSWGRFPKSNPRGVLTPRDAEETAELLQREEAPILPRGAGRSYGDSCLNDDGYLVLSSLLCRILKFDETSGVVRCEAGVTLEQLLCTFVKRGWFLPVTPGTKYVTIGGAIANDVHGKNHHVSGSFGNHVVRFELLRSDGTRIECSSEENTEWYRATIGGLGLTGYVLWADIRMKRVQGPYVDVETTKFHNLEEFSRISREKAGAYEYTVAWVDCIARGKQLGRGLFISGNHSAKPETDDRKIVHRGASWKTVPIDFPSFVLNSLSVRIFNSCYYHRQRKKQVRGVQHYDPFFYPLDSILNWNRIYGRRGFVQWQCVIPGSVGYACIHEVLDRVAASKMASFLVVLKEFGDIPAVGMLSFPIPGITLALDFTNIGPKLFELLRQLDDIVIKEGGRIYPAKDARMSASAFRTSYGGLSEFEKYIDPKFSSSFYRRIAG